MINYNNISNLYNRFYNNCYINFCDNTGDLCNNFSYLIDYFHVCCHKLNNYYENNYSNINNLIISNEILNCYETKCQFIGLISLIILIIFIYGFYILFKKDLKTDLFETDLLLKEILNDDKTQKNDTNLFNNKLNIKKDILINNQILEDLFYLLDDNYFTDSHEKNEFIKVIKYKLDDITELKKNINNKNIQINDIYDIISLFNELYTKYILNLEKKYNDLENIWANDINKLYKRIQKLEEKNNKEENEDISDNELDKILNILDEEEFSNKNINNLHNNNLHNNIEKIDKNDNEIHIIRRSKRLEEKKNKKD